MTTRKLEAAFNPKLGELVDSGSFFEVLNNYHKLFDLSVRVFDEDGNLISEAAAGHNVCKIFGQTENAKKRCIATRMKVKKSLPEDKRLLSIDCLCGLRYTSAPISFNNKILGKLVVGPYRPTEQDRLDCKISIIPPEEQIDLKETEDVLALVRQTPVALIRKIANAMLSVFDAILFSAHKALLASEMHIASVKMSFSELAEKNKQLEEMHDRMKEFDRIKSSFLSTVSHELRTPLTSIIGYSDMLSAGIAGELGEEQLRFIETIKTKGEELLRLISSILDFSQIETGHLTLDVEEINPKKLLENVVEKHKEIAERRGVKLSLYTADDLPKITIDALKIQSAVGHLVDNAIKFSPPGAVVRISAEIIISEDNETDDDEFGFVLMASPHLFAISVQDFGDGIASENHEAIFEPFTQLDASTTREHGGAGLGLAIVKQFVSAHNGTIEVCSTPHEGSRFVIRLPVSVS